jgi:hypothetical protein
MAGVLNAIQAMWEVAFINAPDARQLMAYVGLVPSEHHA